MEKISEPNQLMAIGSDPDLLDKHFILTNDIVFDPNNNPNHAFQSALDCLRCSRKRQRAAFYRFF